jgi:hypothetical protein
VSVARALARIDPSRDAIEAARAGDVAGAKGLVGAAADAAEAKLDSSDSGRRWRAYDLSSTVGEAHRLARSEVRDLKQWEVGQVNRMRIGVFSSYKRLAAAGLVHDHWKQQCPFCGAGVPEDLAHFLLECPSWSRERGVFIVPVLRHAKVHEWLGTAARREELLYVLLGGRVGRRSASSLVRKSSIKSKPAHGEPQAVVAPVPAGAAALPLDVLGHVAAAPLAIQNKSLRSSGLNWLVGVGRYLRAVWPDRTARGPPLSQGRLYGGMAELVAPGGEGAG